MNPGFTYYMPYGLPATGYLDIASVPLAGATVTAGARTYTYGTDFSGNSTFDVAKSLTYAINACRNMLGSSVGSATLNNPINSVFASFTGTRVYIVAAVPGTAGNSLSLASSSAAATVSGATLAGGSAGADIATEKGVVNATTSGLKVVQTSLAANANRLYWFIANHNTDTLKFKMGAACAAGDFYDVLQSASAADAGDGGTWADAAHKGEVSVFSASTYRYTFIEVERT